MAWVRYKNGPIDSGRPDDIEISYLDASQYSFVNARHYLRTFPRGEE